MGWKRYYRHVAAIMLSCLLFTGCSGDTQVLVANNKQETEESAGPPENAQKAGNGTSERDFPAFGHKSVSDSPQTFSLTFPVDMPEKEIAEAWEKISGNPMCEKAARVECCSTECFLEAPLENINPEYLKWAKDSQGTDNPADPGILKNPGKLRITSVYTAEGTEENLLFGLNPGEGSEEAFSGKMIVNFEAGEEVTISANVVTDACDEQEPPSVSQQKHSITLGKVSTEADWMYDSPGIREERLCLKLCREDFNRIAPEADRVVCYYVKSVQGKNAQLRKYVKSLGGYDYIGSYFG